MISPALSFSLSRAQDYLELAKPRLVSLVLLSAAVGFFLAADGAVQAAVVLPVLCGTALVAAGAMALNQWMERDEDARMARTMTRPLPAGRLQPEAALVFGAGLSLSGLAILFLAVNSLTALLALITLTSYLFLYTPLKRRSTLCTIVGAVPGAIPPLIGWAAAQGRPSYEAWILFAIIFLWQMPHFLAIAWIYREQYAAGGFRMLSVEDPSGLKVGRQIVLYSFALLPVSLLPTVAGLTGPLYFFSALTLGAGFITLALKSAGRMEQNARLLFRASVFYLALLLVMMVVDKV